MMQTPRLLLLGAIGLMLAACSQGTPGLEQYDDGTFHQASSKPTISASPQLSPSAGSSLSTTFVSDNSFAGNTFDLEVLNPEGVVITGFDLNLSGTTGTTFVYWKSGVSEGFEADESAWTLAASAEVTPQGINQTTYVPIGDLALQAGSYSFYIWSDSDLITTHYTNGASVYENDDLRLTSKKGLGSSKFSGDLYSPRIWNGRIHYDVASAATDTYTLDAEGVSSRNILYGVRVGQGMSGPEHNGRVSVGGKRVIGGKFRDGQSAKVLEVWGGKRFGVVDNKTFSTPSAGGGQLQFVFNPFFTKELVTVKEVTLYNVIKPGLTVNLYQGRKLVKQVPVPVGAPGAPVKVTLDEPGITIVSVTARFPIAVDDLVVEVPRVVLQ